MPSTEELVRAAQAGDKSAFAQLVRLYERAAIITARAVLGDFHSAQDAAQEAFLIAYRKLNQIYATAAFGPWILKITRRRAVLMQQAQRVRTIDIEHLALTAGQSKDWIERHAKTVEQLAQLPDHERVVVTLRYVDGYSVQEIADLTGRPLGTVTKQLSRAVQRLRTRLSEVRSHEISG